MFVVYPDQECYFEVLSERAFDAYSASRLADPTCTSSRALVAGPEPDVTNHTFLTPTTAPARPRAPTHVPAASPRLPRPSSANPSMPALRLPSRPTFPEAPSALVLPRTAAVRPPPPRRPRRRTRSRSDRWWSTPRSVAISRRSSTRRSRDTRRSTTKPPPWTPATYLLNDLRGDVVRLAESNLADRIVAARRDKEAAYAERVEAEAKAAEAAELEEAERNLAEGMAAMAAEIRRAPVASPPRRDPPVFPPCNFFAAEEGTRTLDLLRTLPARPTLPRRPEPTLPDPVKLADPEPADPRDDFFAETRANENARGRGRRPVGIREGRETSPSVGPLGRFLRGASRGVRSNVPRAIERFRAVSRLGGGVLRRGSSPRGVEPRVTAPRPVERAAPRRSDPRGPGRAPRSFPRWDAFRGGAVVVLPREGGVRAKRAVRRRRGEREATASNDVDGIARVPRSRRAVRTVTGARALRARSRGVHDGARRVVDERVAGSREVQPASAGSRGAVRVKFAPGLVSPGLAARLKVTCAATRPGEYVDEVIITTETQVFALSLSARVAGMDDAENAENFADGGRPERETSERFRTRDDVGVRLDPNLTLDELRERARFGGRR